MLHLPETKSVLDSFSLKGKVALVTGMPTQTTSCPLSKIWANGVQGQCRLC